MDWQSIVGIAQIIVTLFTGVAGYWLFKLDKKQDEQDLTIKEHDKKLAELTTKDAVTEQIQATKQDISDLILALEQATKQVDLKYLELLYNIKRLTEEADSNKVEVNELKVKSLEMAQLIGILRQEIETVKGRCVRMQDV